jgi:hypothetical protein
MKDIYEAPVLEVIRFSCEDVITNSTPVVDPEDGENLFGGN